MRKQGLFFILAFLAIAMMFVLPVMKIGDWKLFPLDDYPLAILTIASGIVPLFLAFVPSKRDIQVRLGAAVSAVMLGLLGFTVYYVVKASGMGGSVGFGAVMPLVALTLNILAIRSVISDIKIINNSNRLR